MSITVRDETHDYLLELIQGYRDKKLYVEIYDVNDRNFIISGIIHDIHEVVDQRLDNHGTLCDFKYVILTILDDVNHLIPANSHNLAMMMTNVIEKVKEMAVDNNNNINIDTQSVITFGAELSQLLFVEKIFTDNSN